MISYELRAEIVMLPQLDSYKSISDELNVGRRKWFGCLNI